MLASTPLRIIVALALCHQIESRSFELQKALAPLADCEDIKEAGYGVGFDLTAGYGIAAVSYRNGSKVVVAKVDGSSDYNELFARLSLASSQHTAPPYTNLRDAFNDRPRQETRKVRKTIGLPASEDVGVLATVLKSLLDAVESYLECKLGSAAATSPHLLALYEEDMGDAFDYLNLYWLRLPVRYRHLRETSAAYAGYGFGLCSNYTDLPACKDELQNWPNDVVMAILHTRKVLTVSLSVTKSTYYLWEPASGMRRVSL